MIIFLTIIFYILSFIVAFLLFHLFIPLKLRSKGQYDSDTTHFELKIYWLRWFLELVFRQKGKKQELFVQLFGFKLNLSKYIKKDKPTSSENFTDTLDDGDNRERTSKKKSVDILKELDLLETFYNDSRNDLSHVFKKILKILKSVFIHSFNLRIKDFKMIVGDEDPYATHKLHNYFTQIKHALILPDKISDNLYFTYYGKELQIKINMFFSIKLYSILFRLFGVVFEYRKIKNLIEKYGNYRDNRRTT